MQEVTKDDVQTVFQEVFDLEELEIYPELNAQDVKNWDSFNHMNLILALEERFQVRFSTEEMAAMANVGDLLVLLNKHGVNVSW
ncbi:acyl carrier protein [Microcoleus sp. herbarium14]|uniref:acyl carrier protein n=1 Tax=Microcoleus sp. herbarium14 TaxID=3055439 RepID=UPI002FD1FAB9